MTREEQTIYKRFEDWASECFPIFSMDYGVDFEGHYVYTIWIEVNPCGFFRVKVRWNENNEMKILYEGPSFEEARNMYCNPTQSKETDHERESCVS